MNSAFRVPILIIAFNRPKTTEKLYEVIKKIKPKDLFVSFDAPRSGNISDEKNCSKVQDIFNSIDWDCRVRKFYHNSNVGCDKSVVGAINWFFEQVDEGIILEDDCLPDTSFFAFCDILLNKYRTDERIMMISGDNFLSHYYSSEDSYLFSRYALIWGWATWKRAWSKYDNKMSTYAEFVSSKKINGVFSNFIQRAFWNIIFYKRYYGYNTAWDSKWTYALLVNSGMCIAPTVNLVENIGFDENATNTKEKAQKRYRIKAESIPLPLNHPAIIMVDNNYDAKTFNRVFVPMIKIGPVLSSLVLVIADYLKRLYEKFFKFNKRK